MLPFNAPKEWLGDGKKYGIVIGNDTLPSTINGNDTERYGEYYVYNYVEGALVRSVKKWKLKKEERKENKKKKG